jgi:hypothetical protein
MQFESDDITHVRHLAPGVLELAAFVHANIHRFAADVSERQRIADAWTELVDHIHSVIGLQARGSKSGEE